MNPNDQVMNRLLSEREPSTLDFDNDDLRNGDSGEERSDNEEEESPRRRAPAREAESPSPAQPVMREMGNTGVKGVLADYAAHQEYVRIAREIQNIKTEYQMSKMTITVNNNDYVIDTSSSSNNNNNNANATMYNPDINYAAINKKPLYEDDEEEEEEDDVWKQYRAKRLAEIKSTSMPTFGFLRHIERSEFVDCIDNEPPSVFVVIHLFQEWHPACRRLNQCLAQLAMEYPHVKFLKIVSTEAADTFDDVCLPSISVYRGGDLYTSIIRVTDLIGNSFDVDNVRVLFKKYKILGQ